MQVLRTGPNHKITYVAGVVRLRVWRNPDLSYEEGADIAEQVRACLDEEAGKPGVKGLFFDIREGPTVAGPRTRDQIGAFFTSYVAHGYRVAVLVREDAVMKMQMARLIDDHCPRGGAVFTDEAKAAEWAAGGGEE
jgi:hypothetical protein